MDKAGTGMKGKEPGLHQYMIKADMHRSESGLTQAFDPLVKRRYNARRDLGDDSHYSGTLLSDLLVLKVCYIIHS